MCSSDLGLASLSAAAGLVSPTLFERRHAVYKDDFGRVHSAEKLHPYRAPRVAEASGATASASSRPGNESAARIARLAPRRRWPEGRAAII